MQQPPLTQQILAPTTRSAIFLVYTVEPSGEGTVGNLLADLSGIVRGVGFRIPDGELSCGAGIGSNLWDRLFRGPRPAALHPLPIFAGARHASVSTPGDLLFHIRAARMDLCFELAGQLRKRLSGAARVVDETHGFKYFDERDLLGFVDGTENPAGKDAVAAVTIDAATDPGFAGGSYVIVQKYLHDINAWNALTIEEQERAIGRSKLDDIEIQDEQKAPNAHTALNVIEDEHGNQLQILRDNMPFGNIGGGPDGNGETGTYFIGYSAHPAVTETMLSNMFIGAPPGNTDRILDFSTAVTGTLFFVPTSEFLNDPPKAPSHPTSADRPRESSLGKDMDGITGTAGV